MKIVIAGGLHAADFIIKSFNNRKHKLIVINESKESTVYLAKSNKIPVIYGEPYNKTVLEEAHISEADVFIAIGHNDTDNYTSCLLAKNIFGVKKCICIVSNPKNVAIFRELGIDTVISSTQLLVSSVLAESSLENLIKAVSLEDDKIVMTEIVVKESYKIAHKRIMDISFPKTGNISCIYRRPNVIIPNGSTIILPKDKLVVVSTPLNQKELIEFIQTPKEIKAKK